MASGRQVAGVRFGRGGPIAFFDAGGLTLRLNDLVVVDSEEGPKVGRVVIVPQQVYLQELAQPLPSLLRRATTEDLAQRAPPAD